MGSRFGVWGERQFLAEHDTRCPRPRGHLAAGCVQVAGVQRRAEPAVRCGRTRLQRRGEREFPCGENENGVSNGPRANGSAAKLCGQLTTLREIAPTDLRLRLRSHYSAQIDAVLHLPLA
jgi:hypothetical protein